MNNNNNNRIERREQTDGQTVTDKACRHPKTHAYGQKQRDKLASQDIQAYKQTDTQTGRQTHRQTDTPTHRRPSRQTDRALDFL